MPNISLKFLVDQCEKENCGLRATTKLIQPSLLLKLLIELLHHFALKEKSSQNQTITEKKRNGRRMNRKIKFLFSIRKTHQEAGK